MTKRTAKIIIGTLAAVLFVVVAVLLTLLFFGVIHLNHPDPDEFPVRGVDLSSWQGAVDWEVLASQDIRFAFIKATEGSSFVDPQFDDNWAAAAQTDLRIGAYHFFSFESSGHAQAELFCRTVSRVERMLPPVVDVEYYGKFRSEKDIDLPAVRQELRALIDALTAAYGTKPILYADGASYRTIIRGAFDDCGLWFRSVYTRAPSDVTWQFWQYSNRHVLQGYEGEERYIDMNVFAGSAEAFETYPY